VASLDQASVRYLIAGGLAVVAHGYGRFTADVDLVLEPDPDALRRAIVALKALGYGPRAPVAFEEFADPARRAAWAREKNMTVFSLGSAEHRSTDVDLFLESPFDFDPAYARAWRATLESGRSLLFVSLQDLLDMKRHAGRARDLQDVAALESIRDEPERTDG
jgi:hypothetical protein